MSKLAGKRIGFALTGSFCTFEKIIPELEKLAQEGCDLYPIMSHNAYSLDTKFGTAENWRKKIERITGKEIVHSVVQAEPIGPERLLDLVIVAPCTGNTLAKLANGVTDTSVTMACKAHWRNDRPVLIAVSTNDGLGANLKNLGILMAMKNVYFVPFGQDNPTAKKNSLVADMTRIIPAAIAAIEGRQLQPVLQ